MPSVTERQHNFMRMSASRRARRKMRTKPAPLRVAREYLAADKAKGVYGRFKRHGGKKRCG